MADKILKFLQRHWFIFLLILLAAFLRLYRLEASLMFLGDQGRDALVLKRLLIDHDLPFIGPITSVGGFYLGPLYYYLMAPFLWLSGFNPIGPAIATAVIGIITVPALYFVAKKLFSPSAAVWASLLYTFAAIPISETRSAWNPNPMPLAALGLLYGLYLANYSKKPQGLILASISLAAAVQLHYMIVFLAPFLLWQLILAFKSPKNRPQILQAALVFILILSPLILFEIKNNFLNFKGLLQFFFKNEYSQLDLWQVIRNMNGRSQQAIGMILGFSRTFNVIRARVTGIFILAMLYLLFKFKQPVFKLLSFWLLSSIATLAVYHSNVYPHYLGFLFPVVFILAGVILSQFKGKLIFLPLSFLLLFSWINLPQVKQILLYSGNLQTVQRTADFIKQDIDNHQYQNINLALLDDTRDYRASNYRYFVELSGVALLDFDQYSQTDLLYVISPYLQPDVLSAPQWEVQALQPAEVIQAWEPEDSDKIYKLSRL